MILEIMQVQVPSYKHKHVPYIHCIGIRIPIAGTLET